MAGNTEEELLALLDPKNNVLVKIAGLDFLLGMSMGKGNMDKLVLETDLFVPTIVKLTADRSDGVSVAEKAYKLLINMSSEEKYGEKLARVSDLLNVIVDEILNEEGDMADRACSVLANLTRPESVCESVIKELQVDFIEKLIHVFGRVKFNKRNNNLHFLGPFLSNLTQIGDVRKILLDKNLGLIQRILPFTTFEDSVFRRGGAVATIRNCCFETESHEWLLDEDVDILPYLLLPLAGPEEFSEDEMEKLPDALQYLPPDKQREQDADLRKMLLEALLQLCKTKHGRQSLREKHTYYILREHHKWEKDSDVKELCENIVQLLISSEQTTQVS